MVFWGYTSDPTMPLQSFQQNFQQRPLHPVH